MSIINYIDIVILSYAINQQLMQMTKDCINSLIGSEDPSLIRFNIIVIESNRDLNGYQYPFTKTIYPKENFGYHRFMNIGIRSTNSEYVCLCNNDLLFYSGWASEIIVYMNEIPDLLSASPICRLTQPKNGIQLNSGIKFGYRVSYEISGWCLFVRRCIFSIIGELDENYIFSGADHDYANTLEVLNLKHGLITSSMVDHLNNRTLIAQSNKRQEELNLDIAYDYHSDKWEHRLLPWKP